MRRCQVEVSRHRAVAFQQAGEFANSQVSRIRTEFDGPIRALPKIGMVLSDQCVAFMRRVLRKRLLTASLACLMDQVLEGFYLHLFYGGADFLQLWLVHLEELVPFGGVAPLFDLLNPGLQLRRLLIEVHALGATGVQRD